MRRKNKGSNMQQKRYLMCRTQCYSFTNSWPMRKTFGYIRQAKNLPLEAPLTCPSSSLLENHTPSKRLILLHNPIHRYFSKNVTKIKELKDTNTTITSLTSLNKNRYATTHEPNETLYFNMAIFYSNTITSRQSNRKIQK